MIYEIIRKEESTWVSKIIKSSTPTNIGRIIRDPEEVILRDKIIEEKPEPNFTAKNGTKMSAKVTKWNKK